MKSETTTEKQGIAERTVGFSLRIIELYRQLIKDDVGRIVGKQLLRSGTSIGANVHEAQGGQSRADFISKISIAYKEALETDYWLRLLQEGDFPRKETIVELREETKQLIKILSSILLTTKERLSA